MENELTDKQRRFIEEYCIDFNATQAAIRAGYSEDTSRQMGSENLSKPYIKAAIKERLDALAMSAEEAVKRLTDWGRGSFAPFVTQDEEHGIVLDLKGATAINNIHLIKKIKQTTRYIGKEKVILEVTNEIELHDAKDAVDKIAKIHKLYGENPAPPTNPPGITMIPASQAPKTHE